MRRAPREAFQRLVPATQTHVTPTPAGYVKIVFVIYSGLIWCSIDRAIYSDFVVL